MEEWKLKIEKAHNRADLIIAKQRHGPTGSIPLLFEAEFTRFGDLDVIHSDYGE
jgi:replicative DNA helicase